MQQRDRIKLQKDMGRRCFVRAGVIAAAAGTAGCSSSTSWRFFTAAEAETINAACECIIPADQDPGAAWAGVVRYIDRQLAGKFKPHRQTYRRGIAALDRMAGGRFAQLSPVAQIDCLTKAERDKELRAFFDLVVAHTMQGFYGSPRHGGNRDWVSWRMLRIPSSPVRGRA
ncbi:MAG TPA: gluconate 2-dehydrogenase subunit 3 family protein [Candidatus Acidoferrales bacterium]|nr:gluconate 2-dehydrogenase subunit 3 family protein [Candidatus Acidoferrales bacterium]